MKLLFSLFLVFCFISLSFAQTTGLPKFRKGEYYKTVRLKMLKTGWKPAATPNADKCLEGDGRCVGRPEMESCAGTGKANCAFRWKRKSKIVMLFTVGETRNNIYTGFRFQ